MKPLDLRLMNNLHNLAQTIRAKVNLRPADCFCGECEPGQIYQCSHCKKWVPWCFGADDYLFDVCDDCFSELDKDNNRTTKVSELLQRRNNN